MAAFSSVIDAYRLPKSSESDAAEHDRVIGAALTDAARVPADVLTSAHAVIELADELLRVDSQNRCAGSPSGVRSVRSAPICSTPRRSDTNTAGTPAA